MRSARPPRWRYATLDIVYPVVDFNLNRRFCQGARILKYDNVAPRLARISTRNVWIGERLGSVGFQDLQYFAAQLMADDPRTPVVGLVSIIGVPAAAAYGDRLDPHKGLVAPSDQRG